jgi:hypothetical protein
MGSMLHRTGVIDAPFAAFSVFGGRGWRACIDRIVDRRGNDL